MDNVDEIKENLLIDCENITCSYNENVIHHVAYEIANDMPRVSYPTYMFIYRPKNTRTMQHRLGRLTKHLKKLHSYVMDIVRMQYVVRKWKHETWKPGSSGYYKSLMNFNSCII